MDYQNSTSLAAALFVWSWGTTHALNSSEEASRYWEIAFYGGPIELKESKQDEAVLASLGIVP